MHVTGANSSRLTIKVSCVTLEISCMTREHVKTQLKSAQSVEELCHTVVIRSFFGTR